MSKKPAGWRPKIGPPRKQKGVYRDDRSVARRRGMSEAEKWWFRNRPPRH